MKKEQKVMSHASSLTKSQRGCHFSNSSVDFAGFNLRSALVVANVAAVGAQAYISESLGLGVILTGISFNQDWLQ